MLRGHRGILVSSPAVAAACGHGCHARALEAAGRGPLEAGVIFIENTASRRLMASMGFREVGIYEKRPARCRWRDVVIVERLIPENVSK
jgi:hypothetical protein